MNGVRQKGRTRENPRPTRHIGRILGNPPPHVKMSNQQLPTDDIPSEPARLPMARRTSHATLPVPSVSSNTGERSIPELISQLTPMSTSHRIREINLLPHGGPVPEPVEWKPVLTELWVKFPHTGGPVFGWLREGAGAHLDAYFGSDGEMRIITRNNLMSYAHAASSAIPPSEQPGARILHRFLHYSVREALTTYYYCRESPTGNFQPVTHPWEWHQLVAQTTDQSLPYSLVCAYCEERRKVKRQEWVTAEMIAESYMFRCRDVGLSCDDPSHKVYAFVRQPPIIKDRQSSNRSPTAPPTLDASHRSLGNSGLESSPVEPQGWRKRLKHWASIPKYEGTASLVLLKGWQAALTEAFLEARVPEGRDQVLAASHFFAGEASKWWAATIGQPLGLALNSFQDLCEALDEHFIPQDAALKALASWKALRQNGTVDDYMRRVDEIATGHPMGEIGEYWLIWLGLRPELRAEVRYALREKGEETCTRHELRRILKGLEVKYPAPPPRPYFPRQQVRQADMRTVPASTVICWVCDKAGHRAGDCSRRKTSGCMRCGSKAHTLLACPQRRETRPRDSSAAPPKGKPPSRRNEH